MEHHYSRPNRGGMNQLLRALGFIFAMILIIGMLDKAGLKITLEGREGQRSAPQHNESSAGDAYAENAPGQETIYVAPDDAPRRSRQRYQPQSYEGYRGQSAPRPSRAAASADDFINRFAETATVQALNKGVPAAISLALGVTKLKQGEKIDSWQAFMNKVVMPLANIKENASRSGLQSYFKYSANSSRWLEGLSRQGDYSYNSLRQAIRKYRLDHFDEEVRTALVEGTSVSPEMDRQASYVADEVSSHIVQQRIARENENPAADNDTRVKAWQNYYQETVGREVAKEIAKRKLKTGQYITEEDMGRLIHEANGETEEVLENNLSFLGRDINRNHPDAPEMLDITKPGNAQARQELYQKKVRTQEYAGNQ